MITSTVTAKNRILNKLFWEAIQLLGEGIPTHRISSNSTWASQKWEAQVEF